MRSLTVLRSSSSGYLQVRLAGDKAYQEFKSEFRKAELERACKTATLEHFRSEWKLYLLMREEQVHQAADCLKGGERKNGEHKYHDDQTEWPGARKGHFGAG
jgi:hypothetical protein